MLVCLPLAAPVGLSPLLIRTLCGSERVLVVSTEPPDDLSCLTTPGVGGPGDGLLPLPLTRCIQMHTPSPCGGLLTPALTSVRWGVHLQDPFQGLPTTNNTASNGRSAELHAPAVDNPSHCSAAISHCVRGFCWATDPVLVPFCVPSFLMHPCSPPTTGAIKQRIQSSHMPPCHRHMVIATNLSSLFDLLHRSIPQTRAKCCLEFTVGNGYRTFAGLSGSALPPPFVPVRRAMQGPPPISRHQKCGGGGGGGLHPICGVL